MSDRNKRTLQAARLTFGDLPERDRSIRTVEGRQITGYPVVLSCPACGEHSSATRGDYWDRLTEAPICGYCGTGMVLATSRSVMITLTPVTAARLTATIQGAYKDNPGYQLPGILDVLQRCYSVIKESDGADEHGEILRELEGMGMGYRP